MYCCALGKSIDDHQLPEITSACLLKRKLHFRYQKEMNRCKVMWGEKSMSEVMLDGEECQKLLWRGIFLKLR